LQIHVDSLIEERNSILAQITALQQDTQKQLDLFAQERKNFHSKISSLQEKLHKDVADLESKCVSLENELRIQAESLGGALVYQEKVFRHSMRWRLGSVFVGGLRIVYDFFKHPIQFSKEAGKRFKEYYREVMPLPIEMPEEVVTPVPESKKIDIIPPLGDYPHITNDLSTIDSRPVSLACILDEFTFNCLKPEINLVTFRPDNWKEILEKEKINAIFVESAWHGNEGSWQYKIAKYPNNMGDELHDIINWANKAGLPSIFWNKEDPPHYDRFIDKAKLFDYVFTSDADCIPAYRKDLGHDRVFSLSFAAQPLIHNPILTMPREHSVAFAGTYYGTIYPERQKDMDLLLHPALDYGLHIFDRQYGMVGPGTEHYRFPEVYKDAIKGRLDYVEMVQAYKNYKVFLNVNSVKSSPTMFSRRVFELMASGTVVISTYSKGIEELLGDDLVLFSDSESGTKTHLENLLTNDDYWSRLSVKGIRKVMEEHTYHHRMNYVLAQCNVGEIPHKPPLFTVMAKIENLQQFENLKHVLGQQTFRQFEVVLVFEKHSRDSQTDREEFTMEFFTQQGHLSSIQNALNEIRVSCIDNYEGVEDLITGDYLAIFVPDNYYGENYLKDYALAAIYSNQWYYLGKYTYYKGIENDEVIQNPGNEFMYTRKVPTGTLAIRRVNLNKALIHTLLQENWFEVSEGENPILSLDRFNYLELSHSHPGTIGLVTRVSV